MNKLEKILAGIFITSSFVHFGTKLNEEYKNIPPMVVIAAASGYIASSVGKSLYRKYK